MPISARQLVTVGVCCSVIGLAGCSTADTNRPPGNNGAPAASAAPEAPPPTDAAGLAALLQKGVSSVSSVHLTLNVTVGNEVIKGAGDSTLADGTLKALDLSEELGSAGNLRVVIVDGATYAQLPATLNKSGKPWVLVTKNSSNPTVRTMATLIESVQTSTSLNSFTVFTNAARNVTLVGKESLEGTPVTHYAIDVDVTKLPKTLPGLQALIGAGITVLPTQLYVDGQGRPVKLTQDLNIQGHATSTVVTLSKFNEPVSISAPPADQVSTS